MADLLALAAQLVDVPSVSHAEADIADHVQHELERAAHLEVERVGNTVVARTQLGRTRRVVLAGHLDTVPPSGPVATKVVGDTLWGLGAVDMKGGVAVLLDLARSIASPEVDVTYVLYGCEEVERRYNELGHLAESRPDLLVGDAAVLGEPTAGAVEAGCQGTMRVKLTMGGRRAHTARPWTGVNAVHRLGRVLAALERFEGRRVELDGCIFLEQLQAVGVDGGVAGNVVPDRASVTVNYRFAPDRDTETAQRALTDFLAPNFDGSQGDLLELLDVSSGAAPSLGHPVLAALVEATGRPPSAKLGWTDVATFAARGVPATNFGPGDPLLAHTSEEHVTRAELEHVHDVLARLITAR
ncbi:MAG TPA: succinyl-diaminopimelate desuccinylase [Acidimicrobiales bacterium]|nr:succinyl-diaminopimelate desuccinylase [Acidimicrobiales bacterium]